MEKDYELLEGGPTLIVIFASYGYDGQIHERAMGIPRFEFYKTLSAFNATSLFVVDPRRHWYHSGITGLSEDIHSTAEKLKSISARFDRTITLGHSMGGYAALLFSALCGFKAAIATAPQITILKEHRVDWLDHRWGDKILETRAASKSPEYFDIKDTLARNNDVEYLCYYSSGDAIDKRHCEYVSGVPGVSITEIKSDDHNTAKAIRDQGILQAELKRLCGEQ